MSTLNDTSSIHSISQHDTVKLDMRDALTTPHSNPSNPFAFTPDQLAALQDPKNIDLLHTYGGLEGVARGLHANVHTGLDPHTTIDANVTLLDITNDKQQIKDASVTVIEDTTAIIEPQHTGPYAQRSNVFGANVLPPVKGKNIFQLMWLAFNDKTLVIIYIYIYTHIHIVQRKVLISFLDFISCGRCCFIGCGFIRRYCSS